MNDEIWEGLILAKDCRIAELEEKLRQLQDLLDERNKVYDDLKWRMDSLEK